jgi:UDP-N-acetylglucosamine 2-epimerase (non-hydrolysing)
MTLHRSENVDHEKTLVSIISGILEVMHDVIFPVHPRTAKRLREFNLYEKLSKSENVLLLDSVGYFEMLELMKNCSFIVTDSGGIQEEATAPKIRKKVLVTRKTTDRPEAVTAGMSEVVGVEKRSIVKAIKKTIRDPTIPSRNTPFGKGDASKKIIEILQKNL